MERQIPQDKRERERERSMVREREGLGGGSRQADREVQAIHPEEHQSCDMSGW